MPTPVTQYAQISDFDVAGVPASAIASYSPTQKNQALINASRLLDGYFRSKFTLPFVKVGQDVARATAIVAAYDLMVTRGYNPSSGADSIILTRYKEIIGDPPSHLGWADLVSNGKLAPDVTDSSTQAVEGSPSSRARVISSSQRGFSGRSPNQRSSSGNGPFTTD